MVDVDTRRVRTAIVGTGLAGLTTAHLLHTDSQQRFSVTLFEQADALAFDSASVAVRNQRDGTVDRIDLPMRASAGGYYAQLNRMYQHLGIPTHPIRFLFVFAKALNHLADEPRTPSNPPAYASSVPGGYFIHASNGHRVPPPRPSSHTLPRHLLEILYLVLSHLWFTLSCFLLRPGPAESFSTYLRRARVPRRYTTHYLLPLLSAVSTCTHPELLAFPATDLVGYIARSYNQHHYTVCGGVGQVQARLVCGIADVRLRSRVIQVVPRSDEGGVLVRWQVTDPATGRTEVREEAFDRVVLAVSPDVTGRIFPALAASMAGIPTVWVESSVMAPAGAATGYSIEENSSSSHKCMHCRSTSGGGGGPAEVITLRTEFSGAGTRTEALHVMPSGVEVRTCPLSVGAAELKRTLKTAGFTRTLRTVESKATVERIMRGGDKRRDESGWTNGDGNGVVVGVLAGVTALVFAAAFFVLKTDQYDLDHWKLNFRTPVRSMWMNLGYWTSPSGDPVTDFDEACANLLREVLVEAGIVHAQKAGADDGSESPPLPPLAVLDLGIGCGDQTVELCRLARENGRRVRYVGLTLNELQLGVARRRVHREITKWNQEAASNPASLELFRADAAKPHRWDSNIQRAVHALAEEEAAEGWLLALDCLYHFSPSRQPILSFAATELKFNFAAFDLMMNDAAPWYFRQLARLIGLLMGCPWGAFVGEDGYRKQMVRCGYESDSIIFRDISDHVFAGLVGYLTRQEHDLAKYGIPLGAGFKVARSVFRWFERTKVIRGVIVVGRTDRKSHHVREAAGKKN
ncbi:hypothetical protein QBC39DRAFT_332897 [Podospora conica]|nr:hypothetical protein QBC39DRAFT_332897 [Schizothecium conicum]